jgi:penicillin amidase
MADLLPPYARDWLSIVPGGAAVPLPAPPLPLSQQQQAPFERRACATLARQTNAAVRDFLIGGSQIEARGSNNWLVDGTLTASGKPMLANDPHLATHVPSLWYLAHLSAGDFDLIGATLPGAPAVAIGRNKFIAWGETNVAADVEDLFVEHVNASGTTVEYQGGQEPIKVVPETIVVKGAPSIQLNVRVTRHGPLVSDAINAASAESKIEPKPPEIEPLAFRWTARR